MIEPTFDWREQPEGSAGGAWADGPEAPADEELLRRYRDARDHDDAQLATTTIDRVSLLGRSQP